MNILSFVNNSCKIIPIFSHIIFDCKMKETIRNKTILKCPINLQSLLYRKYSSSEYDYTYINTTRLIYNENCLLAAKFKDYLIYDDLTEFFRRYYTSAEIYPRLARILSFFKTYSKIFPNYMALPEADHLFRNIRKKQKVIDAMNAIKQEEEENRKNLSQAKKSSIEPYQSNCNVVFTSKINKSILKYEPSKTITESSISSSLWAKKIHQGLDNSFAYSSNNQSDDDNRKTANDNYIEELMHILNGKINNSLADCQINVQTTSINNQLSTEQTPKDFRTKTHNFFHHHHNASKKKKESMPIYNRTAVKRKNINKPVPTTSLYRNNINNINHAFQSKPINNLNIITNHFQSIVIPQSASGGNTVININNNFFSCSDMSMKKRRHSRAKSDSFSLNKKSKNDIHSNVKTNKNNLKVDLINSDFNTKAISRSKKREGTPLLGLLNLPDHFKSQSIAKTILISHTRTKSASKAVNLKKNNNNNYNSNDNPNKTKNIGKYSSNNIKYHSSRIRSPIRERELNKEKIITDGIKHRFKMFIERSKVKQLTSKNSCSSISPQKSVRNQSSNNLTSAMQKYSIHNSTQKNIKNEISNQIKMINDSKSKVISPLSHSLNENNNLFAPLIKVNTKAYFQRATSSCLRKGININKNTGFE